MGQRDVQHLFEREGRVDCGGDREQEGRPIARPALVGQRGLELTGRAAQTHQGDGQEDEGNDQQNRNDEQHAGGFH